MARLESLAGASPRGTLFAVWWSVRANSGVGRLEQSFRFSIELRLSLKRRGKKSIEESGVRKERGAPWRRRVGKTVHSPAWHWPRGGLFFLEPSGIAAERPANRDTLSSAGWRRPAAIPRCERLQIERTFLPRDPPRPHRLFPRGPRVSLSRLDSAHCCTLLHTADWSAAC